MPKKPAAPNAFYYFMVEFKNKQGRKFSNMSEVAAVAGPHWNRMSKADKKPFEDRAKAEKEKRGKLTSAGDDADQLVKMEKLMQAMRAEMREDIDHTIKIACQVEGIRKHQFFIVHLNMLLPNPIREVFYPCEIAVSVFTLQDGVDNVFHKHVFPGQLPLGYACEAKIYSQNSHQLYNSVGQPDSDNIEETYIELSKFLKENSEGSNRMPILYTDDRIIDTVRDVLDSWSNQFGDGPIFKVYSLQYMLRVLKNACCGANAWFSDTPSVTAIEKDLYCFTNGICCDWHDTTEGVHYCSRSFVVRYAYLVCDTCCGDLDITLRYGSHIPAKCKTSSTKTSSRSSVSSYSSSSTSRTSTVSDTDDIDSVSSYQDWDSESVSTLNNDPFDDVSDFNGTTNGRKRNDRMSSRPPALPSFSQASIPHIATIPGGAWSNVSRGYSGGDVHLDEYPALGRGRGSNRRAALASGDQPSLTPAGGRGWAGAVRGKRTH